MNKATKVVEKEKYKIIGHRDGDVLFGRNGEQISAAAINFHNDSFANVKSYQFVQDIPGECRLYVVPNSGKLTKEDCQRIAQNISKKFNKTLKCHIIFCDAIMLTERGKYKMVIQNWKENGES